MLSVERAHSRCSYVAAILSVSLAAAVVKFPFSWLSAAWGQTEKAGVVHIGQQSTVQ